MNASRRRWIMGVCAFGFVAPGVDGQSAESHLAPSEDGFTRGLDRFVTLGSAGGLHVAGGASTNGLGTVQGEADSWLKFDASVAVAGFNTTFGAGGWTLTGATLAIEAVAVPRNPVFARGVGAFTVNWVANDGWTEGEGTPASPGSVTGSDLSYHSSRARLDSGLDEVLGGFRNTGSDGMIDLKLVLTGGFVADIAAGEELTLVLAASEGGMGFTFHSVDWKIEAGRPRLALTAQPASPGGGGVVEGDDPVPDSGAAGAGGGGGVSDAPETPTSPLCGEIGTAAAMLVLPGFLLFGQFGPLRAGDLRRRRGFE